MSGLALNTSYPLSREAANVRGRDLPACEAFARFSKHGCMKWCSDAADQVNLHQNLACWCFWGVTGSLHPTPDCLSCKDLTANVGKYSLTDGWIDHACEPGVNREKTWTWERFIKFFTFLWVFKKKHPSKTISLLHKTVVGARCFQRCRAS